MKTKKQHIAKAIKELKFSARIDGIWLYFKKADGSLLAQYQIGVGEYFALEKSAGKVWRVGKGDT